MDLLTVIMHERGYLLGHDQPENGVLDELLTPGGRRVWDQEPLLDSSTHFDQTFDGPGLTPSVVDGHFGAT